MWTQLINFSFCKAYSNCMYFKGIEGMGRGLKEFFFIYWELATIYLQHRLLFLVHLLYKLACMVSFLLWEVFFLWSSIELCDCSSKKKRVKSMQHLWLYKQYAQTVADACIWYYRVRSLSLYNQTSWKKHYDSKINKTGTPAGRYEMRNIRLACMYIVLCR